MALSWACEYSPAVGAGVGAAAALSAMCCVVAPSAGRQSRSKKKVQPRAGLNKPRQG